MDLESGGERAMEKEKRKAPEARDVRGKAKSGAKRSHDAK